MGSEKVMYVLVPYNLSDIQKGIQAAHAIVEYGRVKEYEFKYSEWAQDHETIIILNGGTTGENSSMYQYILDLSKLGVETAKFREPDLNDALTAVAFILDKESDSHIIGYLKQMKLA